MNIQLLTFKKIVYGITGSFHIPFLAHVLLVPLTYSSGSEALR